MKKKYVMKNADNDYKKCDKTEPYAWYVISADTCGVNYMVPGNAHSIRMYTESRLWHPGVCGLASFTSHQDTGPSPTSETPSACLRQL